MPLANAVNLDRVECKRLSGSRCAIRLSAAQHLQNCGVSVVLRVQFTEARTFGSSVILVPSNDKIHILIRRQE